MAVFAAPPAAGFGRRRAAVAARAASWPLAFALVLSVYFVVHSHWVLHAQQEVHLGGPDDAHALMLTRGSRPVRRLTAEVWAGFAPPHISAAAAEVSALLTVDERRQLEELCGRCLMDELFMMVGYHNGEKVFVATGDIPFMWIRDSAVQLGALLPRISRQPALRLVVEGAVRTQAFMIVQDPYANAYYLKWKKPSDHNKFERLLGRGGWVATRNYELDSGAYFLQLLWDIFSLPGYGRAELLAEPVVYEAASLLVDIWTIEQHHEEKSQYRYSELPRDGRGPPSNYTGMSWSGFRPSDDPQKYGYNVPVNMYAQAALERALEINAAVWRSRDFEQRARKLAQSIREGIERFGIVEVDGVKVYAYEVDGLGGRLFDFDDANVPSLLSIPLLGFKYDAAIYNATRARILSSKNPHYYSGQQLRGIGSPHTPANNVWPLAIAVQGLTTTSPTERAEMLRTLLKMQCGNGLMHESVNVDNLGVCTRTWFGWANAMLVALVESGLGLDCSISAERQRLARIQEREDKDASNRPTNGGADIPLYYETLEANIAFDRDTLEIPSYVGGTSL